MKRRRTTIWAWLAAAVGVWLAAGGLAGGEEPKPGSAMGTATGTGTDTSPAPGAPTPLSASGMGTAEVEAPAQPDCHGPLYYKLINQDKEQRAVEAARNEVERFAGVTGEKLVAASYAEGVTLITKRREEWLSCLAKTRRPSVLCRAVVRGDEKLCLSLVSPERREPCLLLSRVFAAVVAGRPDLCAAVADGPERKLCDFAAGGNWACNELPDGPLARVCGAVGGGSPGGVLPGDLSPEEQAAAAWLRAIVAREAVNCDRIQDEGERGACRAAAARSENVCPPARPTIEYLDDDYSCRNLVLSWRTHATASGTELVAQIGGSFPGRADCEVKVKTAGSGAPGAPPERTIGAVHPDKGLDVTEIRVQVAGVVDRVEADCRWDPESSRFVLKDSDAGVW